MTTKPKIYKYNIGRRSDTPSYDKAASRPAAVTPEVSDAAPSVEQAQAEAPSQPVAEFSEEKKRGIEEIAAQNYRSWRLGRAKKNAIHHGIDAATPEEAIWELQQRGIDPFVPTKTVISELVDRNSPAQPATGQANAESIDSIAKALEEKQRQAQMAAATRGQSEIGRIQLPDVAPQNTQVANVENPPEFDRNAEISRVQKEIAKRRQKKLVLLISRMAVFILLPTLLAGYYFFFVATPMYATNTAFSVQTASPTQSDSGGGLGGLLGGGGLGSTVDSISVQDYLNSLAAMKRLDEEEDFRGHFSSEDIDILQRLPEDASETAMFNVYQKRVVISFDLTEGAVRLEVIAASPETSQRFAEALVGYAEDHVNEMSERMRNDQMKGAIENYERAETDRDEALAELLRIQNELEVLDPVAESGAVMSQVTNLEAQLTEKQIELSTLESQRRPNQARIAGVNQDISQLQIAIAELRAQLTSQEGDTGTLAAKNIELRMAEENYNFQLAMVQNAATAREGARLEAERQGRFLQLSVPPIPPDEPTYPRAFENTLVTAVILAAIYLMLSLTGAVLREQVSA